MAEEMRLMRETINQQYAEIAKLNRNIESLNHQLRKKNERITELEDRLSKYEGPDSKVKKKEQNVFAYIIFSMLYTIQSIAIWMLII